VRQQLGLGRGSRVSFAVMGGHIEVRAWKPPHQPPTSGFGLLHSRQPPAAVAGRLRSRHPPAAVIGLDTNVLANYNVAGADADGADPPAASSASR
jgi:hypothetical protein